MGEVRRSMCALIVAVIWGTTFLVSRSLLVEQLRPMDLIMLRFVSAYLVMLVLCPRPLGFEFDRRELWLVMVGLFGGSIYYVLEYNALRHSTAVNVGLICATVPIVTAVVNSVIGRRCLSKSLLLGSVIAIVGVAFILFDGRLEYQVHFVGDILAMGAVVSWAVYSIFIDKLSAETDVLSTTRRLFFYGTISLVLLMVGSGEMEGVVGRVAGMKCEHWIGAMYLGVIASGVCMFMWNKSYQLLGEEKTNNFLYLLPLITALGGVMFARAEMSVWIALGGVLIFLGLVVAGRERKDKEVLCFRKS